MQCYVLPYRFLLCLCVSASVLACSSSPSTTGDQGADDTVAEDTGFLIGDAKNDAKSDVKGSDVGTDAESSSDAESGSDADDVSDAGEEVLNVEVVGDISGATCKTADDCTGKINVPECHKAACNPTLGKCFVALLTDGTACSGAADLCVEGAGTCTAGQCIGTPKDCDDKNVCTDDSCDTKAGCVHTPKTGPCDDGSKCTTGEACAGGVCAGGQNVCAGGPELDCANKVDDDGDGLTDCADNDCASDTVCKNLPKETVCNDKKDDDGDGLTDCADPDCAGVGGCAVPKTETSCVDKVDNDKDGAVDCADNDCASNLACKNPLHETNCKDTVDEDVDGKTDCADSDCTSDVACTGTAVESNCGDGVDNDKDGSTDCSDNDCAIHPPCAPTGETNCTDKIDEDKDGKTDCADSDCAANLACAVAKETNCTDKVDNDKDGFVDCKDLDCADDVACATKCSHDICTTGDYLSKSCDPCVTAVCKADSVCCSASVGVWDDVCVSEVGSICGQQCPGTVETKCSDGKDNDSDGTTDCADSDCKADAACIVKGCAAAGSGIGCGTSQTGNNGAAGSTQNLSTYKCADGNWSGETGPEFVQLLTATCDGDMTIGLQKASATGGYLDLFVLDGSKACDANSCTAHALMTGGAANLILPAKKGQQFLLVVDGYSGYADDFALKVTCDCPVVPETNCTDTIDNDGDGSTDCSDNDCAVDLACKTTPETLCGNSIDDDKDGKTDCADSDCAKDAACKATVETDCGNGSDDDGDGSTDCADSDCALNPACACKVDFTLPVGVKDNWNNSGNGSTNNVDVYTCPSETVGNETGSEYVYGITANCDGLFSATVQLTDFTSGFLNVFLLDGSQACSGGACLADGLMNKGVAVAKLKVKKGQKLNVAIDGYQGYNGNFAISTACIGTETLCGDKVDNDGDGLTDCADSECVADLACASTTSTGEKICDDGKDNDSDGLTDCDDSDCAAASNCTCAPDNALTCGDNWTFWNDGPSSTQNIETWQCKDGTVYGETGNEYTFTYTATCSSPVTISINKTQGTGFLDLFVLDGGGICGPSACTNHSLMTSGKASVKFNAVKGQSYDVTIDGYNSASAKASLAITCSCP